MLSKDHLDNFNDHYIRLTIPAFTVDGPDHDKIWALFCWMIGQNWGFENFMFYWLDYKTLTPLTAGTPNENVIPRWNEKYGKWMKMGIYTQAQSFVEFVDTEWEFVEWECRDPRMQRMWIHLYNQVWCGRHLRADIFETEKALGYGLRNLHVDHGWWMSNQAFKWRESHRVDRLADYVPHYIKSGHRKEMGKSNFAGKIKLENTNEPTDI